MVDNEALEFLVLTKIIKGIFFLLMMNGKVSLFGIDDEGQGHLIMLFSVL